MPADDARSSSDRALNLSIAFATGLLLFLPAMAFWLQDISTAHLNEEFTAHGYFYSLRALYGGEHPWQPHMYLVFHAYMALHKILTIAGLPPSLSPRRIDLFNLMACGIPCVLTTILMAWTLRAVSSIVGKIAIAALLLAFSYRPEGLYVLLTASYYTWAIPVSVGALGWTLRVAAPGFVVSTRSAVALGLLLGLALAVKITYAVMLLPVFVIWLLSDSHRPATWWRILLAGSVAISTWLFVVAGYYHFNLVECRSYVGQLIRFLASARLEQPPPADMNVIEWMWSWGWSFPPTIETLMIFLPLLVGVGFALFPQRFRISLAITLTLPATLWLYYNRYYSWTLVEVAACFFLLSVVWGGLVFDTQELLSRLASFDAGRTNQLRTALGTLVILLSITLAIPSARADYAINQRSFRRSQEAYTKFEEFRRSTPGRTLLLIPDNSYRFLTLHGAYCKGGMEIYKPWWGVSPMIVAMLPDFECVTARTEQPPQLREFTTLGFVRNLIEDKEAALRRTLTHYAIPLRDAHGLECPLEIVQGGTVIVGCHFNAQR